MDQYIATVKVKGLGVRTAIFADSVIHARLLLQYQYGVSSILTGPTRA